ncbi:hypothetical protein FACS1894176_02500 [Bacteroidia bacterium]|nr:hypothetical protein FACS1894176_02500 [Bacteroidia bacterium]
METTEKFDIQEYTKNGNKELDEIRENLACFEGRYDKTLKRITSHYKDLWITATSHCERAIAEMFQQTQADNRHRKQQEFFHIPEGVNIDFERIDEKIVPWFENTVKAILLQLKENLTTDLEKVIQPNKQKPTT